MLDAPRFNSAAYASFALLLTSTIALAQAPAPSGARRPQPAPSHAKGPSRYAGYVHTWHTPAPDRTAPVDASGRPMLALYSLNTNDRITLAAATDHGVFAASDLDRAAFVLREPATGNQHPIEPRLLDLVYRVQTHFQAQEIRIVSAYRTPRRGNGSNHGKGRAMDLVVPGTSDADVAKFARSLGFVGVGVYPTSGFVHVDARDRSYFWVDQSAPGRRNRERGILGDVAKASDHDAAARGERALGPPILRSDVDAAIRAQATTPTPAADDDDDDDPGGI